MRPPRSTLLLLVLLLLPALAAGCVRRTIRITSTPPGALVWVNDREMGRTPLEFEFVHYGTYDVRLVRDGFEAMHTSGDAKPPLWDNVGLDLVAGLLPLDFHAEIDWHYDMTAADADPARVREDVRNRARAAREAATSDEE